MSVLKNKMSVALLVAVTVGSSVLVAPAGAAAAKSDTQVAASVLKTNRQLVEGWKKSNPTKGAPSVAWTDPRLHVQQDTSSAYLPGKNGTYCLATRVKAGGTTYAVDSTSATPVKLVGAKSPTCKSMAKAIKISEADQKRMTYGYEAINKAVLLQKVKGTSVWTPKKRTGLFKRVNSTLNKNLTKSGVTYLAIIPTQKKPKGVIGECAVIGSAQFQKGTAGWVEASNSVGANGYWLPTKARHKACKGVKVPQFNKQKKWNNATRTKFNTFHDGAGVSVADKKKITKSAHALIHNELAGETVTDDTMVSYPKIMFMAGPTFGNKSNYCLATITWLNGNNWFYAWSDNAKKSPRSMTINLMKKSDTEKLDRTVRNGGGPCSQAA